MSFMKTAIASPRLRGWAVLAALAGAFMLSDKDTESLGTTYQIALPTVALGCAVANGDAPEFALRYAAQLVLVHGPKTALGDAAINQRPRGGNRGFPSGHTATATLGASYLVHECVMGNPVVQGVAVLTAGFVGASRAEVGAHTAWQVFWGAVAGWIAERAFRRRTRRIRWLRLPWARHPRRWEDDEGEDAEGTGDADPRGNRNRSPRRGTARGGEAANARSRHGQFGVPARGGASGHDSAGTGGAATGVRRVERTAPAPGQDERTER